VIMRAAVAALVLALTAACGHGITPPAAKADASLATGSGTPAQPRGRIRGVVTLVGTPPSSRFEAALQNKDVCGQTVPVTRLAVGKDNGVRQTFVYLDGIAPEETALPRSTIQVEQKGCEYGPHAAMVTPGTDLEIVNQDPILHNVHAREAAPDGPITVFNIAQPVRGQRTKVEAPLDTPGIVALTCEAGHPWMTAYILVARHPYVATTNDAGEFVIDNVPAGSYPIRMWHEGVRLTRVIPSLQRYEWEEPYESTQQVLVAANGETVVHFELELRPEH